MMIDPIIETTDAPNGFHKSSAQGSRYLLAGLHKVGPVVE